MPTAHGKKTSPDASCRSPRLWRCLAASSSRGSPPPSPPRFLVYSCFFCVSRLLFRVCLCVSVEQRYGKVCTLWFSDSPSCRSKRYGACCATLTLWRPVSQKHGVCTQDLFVNRHYFRRFSSENDADSQKIPSNTPSVPTTLVFK